MTTALSLTARITDGKLPVRVLQDLTCLAERFDGKTLVIEVREQKRRRSLNQNRYLWGVVVRQITQAFREAGNVVDDDDVYSYLKSEVWKLKRVIVTPNGEVLRCPGSTSDKTTIEMEVLLEQARAWAADVLGIHIPLPHEELSTEAKEGK